MPRTGTDSDLVRLRHEYESSISWKITRPLRAAANLARRARAQRPAGGAPAPDADRRQLTEGVYDAWLAEFCGEQLGAIDAACASGGPERFALFRELSDDVWSLLLGREYELYPNIRALLPDVPEPLVQQLWNGSSGAALAAQSQEFYVKLRERFGRFGPVSMGDARVLDFGCGWGRLTRLLARDVAAGRLYGCDPVQGMVDICRNSRIPAQVERTEFVPAGLPFDEKFDLVFAFSVFTHLSEPAHEACLSALHRSLAPGGLLMLTVRPLAWLWDCELMAPAREQVRSDFAVRTREPLYLFVPHPADPGHPQYSGPEMTYGETVITRAYIEERWLRRFELLAVDLLIGDLHQVVLTLRRRA